jgi:hypothetical protein
MTPSPTYAHIRRMSDAHGIFEHAKGIVPRVRGGYCLDDAARALIVMCRAGGETAAELSELSDAYLRLVLNAQVPDGRCHNRLNAAGYWEDQPSLGDWWGRALWALGTAAARSPQAAVRDIAVDRFRRGAEQRSAFVRSMAFAALGAAEILTVAPGLSSARALLADLVAMVGRPDFRFAWPWPEPRLGYANAAIAEALIAAGHGLGDDEALSDGLGLLGWLLDSETVDGHLSVTPVGGRALGDAKPAYDQQPIEVAALADACARAWEITGQRRWSDGLDLAVAWFLGANDGAIVMWDADSGGGFDALTRGGRNTNQGAESTLAMVATLQHHDRLLPVGQ